MSNHQSTANQSLHLQEAPIPRDYEEQMTWRLRWFLIIIITNAYLSSLIGGLIGFWLTGDFRYLCFITPTILIPFVYYLVPMDKKMHEIKLAKVSANKELREIKLRVSLLEKELRATRLTKRYEKLPAKS